MFGWFKKKAPKKEAIDPDLQEWAIETARRQLKAEGWEGLEIAKLTYERSQELIKQRLREEGTRNK